jgi:hypothetical protein
MKLIEFLPWRLRNYFDLAHRKHVLNKAMYKFLQNPELCFDGESSVLGELFYGWGNEAWSAENEYLLACVKYALTCNGPILECGSGLSTLLVGGIAKKRGIEHIVFEHIGMWSKKIRQTLDKYELTNSTICDTPIRDYGDYSWYDISTVILPEHFAMIVCDGPPSSIKGGRYGLVPLMKDRFSSDCVILLDDADREQEHEVVRQWQNELDLGSEMIGDTKPYFLLSVN